MFSCATYLNYNTTTIDAYHGANGAVSAACCCHMYRLMVSLGEDLQRYRATSQCSTQIWDVKGRTCWRRFGRASACHSRPPTHGRTAAAGLLASCPRPCAAGGEIQAHQQCCRIVDRTVMLCEIMQRSTAPTMSPEQISWGCSHGPPTCIQASGAVQWSSCPTMTPLYECRRCRITMPAVASVNR